MNNVFDQYEVWFVTGAQLLYGGDAVIAVDAHSNEMVNGLNESGKLPVKVVYKGTANSSKEVETVFKAANNDEKCVGVITWMHTFSPAKMWIHGLQQLKKPLLHLHTQFNKEIPWDTMDMDFMNLNQSAHGDREFGHICTRMRIRRKVVVGYWKEEDTLHKIAVWMRVCAGWADSQDMLIIRFGDQMNNVAVTDGDKVEAEQRMGYHVDYCPVSELMEYHKEIKNEDVDALVATYFKEYDHDASLEKPLLHLHTQFNKEIPWDTMDMDFMNLNQSAHGDREFGHICTRMRIRRKVVVGYWKEEDTLHKIAVWMRVCAGWADSQDMLIIRFGDQMNNVAVTDGDKVEAEQRMGYHVDYCPVSELMEYHKEIKNEDVDALVATYFKEYDHDASLEDKSTEAYQKVWNAAKAELAMRAILKAKGAKGFTTNFDDLGDIEYNGFDQIPGLASQRLMAEGYGFGAEGDWKSAALYRTVWVMNQGLPKGCSFLEDYTLNFDGANSSILQSHMLEICPLIAANKPRLEVHFLGIGIRKSQTARLVFTSKTGAGCTATIVDMGNRFRLIVNDVECIEPKPLPKLPVASALWIPMPNLEVGAGAWILAGGTHHSCFSYDLTAEYWEDYAEIAGIEMVHINKDTTISCFKKELRMNEVYYMLNKALC